MSSAVAPLAALLQQLDARITALEKTAGVAGVSPLKGVDSASAPIDGLSKLAEEFDGLVQKFGVAFKDVCDRIGGDAVPIGSAVLKLWILNKSCIDMAGKSKKWEDAVKKKATDIFTDAAKAIKALDKSGAALANHAKAASEAAPAFAWIFTEPGPLGVIESGRDSAEFWANKVRKESKEKTLPDWMLFANLLRDGLNAQYAFVKENFKTGLAWNPRGVSAAEYPLGDASAPAAVAAPIPPAGAAAPPAAAGSAASASSGSKPSLGAMFSQISSIDQSSGRTAGLRHVDKKQVAEEKAKAPVPSVVVKAAAAPKLSHRDRDLFIPTGEAAVKLVEMRWNVEFQVNNKDAPSRVTEGTMKHEVYVFACRDSVIYVDSKVKNVRIDTCRDIVVFVHSALSGIEVVNCKKVKIQVLNSVPSVAIDKTDGIVIGLSFAGRNVQLVTSKSSEMNVTFPISDSADADWVENAIPEQFYSHITEAGKLVTTVSELYSS